MQPIVEFILDGKLFAARTWQVIPRVGEVVLLKNGEVWAEVTQVVWGDDSKVPIGIERQWVQILCKTIERTDGT
jgi:hypothetical protein